MRVTLATPRRRRRSTQTRPCDLYQTQSLRSLLLLMFLERVVYLLCNISERRPSATCSCKTPRTMSANFSTSNRRSLLVLPTSGHQHLPSRSSQRLSHLIASFVVCPNWTFLMACHPPPSPTDQPTSGLLLPQPQPRRLHLWLNKLPGSLTLFLIEWPRQTPCLLTWRLLGTPTASAPRSPRWMFLSQLCRSDQWLVTSLSLCLRT